MLASSTYDLNGWGPATDTLPWAPDEEFHTRMQRLGYHRWFEVPEVPDAARARVPLSLDVWGDGPAPWPIVVILEQYEIATYDEILVARAAALWRLLGELVPVIERLHTLESAVQRDVLLRRAYRAWHGHDADEVCRACDPDEASQRAAAWRGRHPAGMTTMDAADAAPHQFRPRPARGGAYR